MSEQVLSIEPLPGAGVRLVVCADGAGHVEPSAEHPAPCPLDLVLEWGRTEPGEPDADFVDRIRQASKLLAAEHLAQSGTAMTASEDVPKGLGSLVGKAL